jgi:hypothetical protein
VKLFFKFNASAHSLRDFAFSTDVEQDFLRLLLDISHGRKINKVLGSIEELIIFEWRGLVWLAMKQDERSFLKIQFENWSGVTHFCLKFVETTMGYPVPVFIRFLD